MGINWTAFAEVGEVGERTLQDGSGKVVEEKGIARPDLFAHWKWVRL